MVPTCTQGTLCFNCPLDLPGFTKTWQRKQTCTCHQRPPMGGRTAVQPAGSSILSQHACLTLSELQPVASLSLGEEEEGGSGSCRCSWEDLPSPGWTDPSHGSPWHPALPPLTQMVSASPCQASKIFPMCSSHPFQQTPCLAQCCSLSALISSLCL